MRAASRWCLKACARNWNASRSVTVDRLEMRMVAFCVDVAGRCLRLSLLLAWKLVGLSDSDPFKCAKVVLQWASQAVWESLIYTDFRIYLGPVVIDLHIQTGTNRFLLILRSRIHLHYIFLNIYLLKIYLQIHLNTFVYNTLTKIVFIFILPKSIHFGHTSYMQNK